MPPILHICLTYPFLQSDCIIDCIIDYFCTEPLKTLVLHICLFKFVIITLHYFIIFDERCQLQTYLAYTFKV